MAISQSLTFDFDVLIDSKFQERKEELSQHAFEKLNGSFFRQLTCQISKMKIHMSIPIPVLEPSKFKKKTAKFKNEK